MAKEPSGSQPHSLTVPFTFTEASKKLPTSAFGIIPHLLHHSSHVLMESACDSHFTPTQKGSLLFLWIILINGSLAILPSQSPSLINHLPNA